MFGWHMYLHKISFLFWDIKRIPSHLSMERSTQISSISALHDIKGALWWKELSADLVGVRGPL